MTEIQAIEETKQDSINHLYRHFDKDGELLYVGVSLSAIGRLCQHRDHSHWFRSIASVSIESFPSRKEVLEAEKAAIQKENPKFNIQRPKTKEEVRDDKKTPVEKSLFKLVGNVVNFEPAYSIEGAATAAGIRNVAMKRLVSEGKIGHFVAARIKGQRGFSEMIRITGWQLLEFIERLEKVGDIDKV